jgi:hypothetical protein
MDAVMVVGGPQTYANYPLLVVAIFSPRTRDRSGASWWRRATYIRLFLKVE